MPIFIQKKILSDIHFLIWQISEPESFFRASFPWAENELTRLVEVHPKRRLEYLASRYVLYTFTGTTGSPEFIKNEFGKLNFKQTNRFLSISHSGEYTGFVTGPYEVGLDIQMLDAKIIRILHKYLSTDELEFLNNNFLNHPDLVIAATLCWCAKEAVYKAHGKRGIQFNTQIYLKLLVEQNTLVIHSASLYLADDTIHYAIYHEVGANFCYLVATKDS
ncbi:MAG: 4'-phosphopantetheinyl transferase superfamily protein [Saprospiraceae bacterium]|nr:4'-phosphopantetheinyl transferase superfamily protein [Saprospiraceae bacterium]